MRFDVKINFITGVCVAEISLAIFKYQPPAFLLGLIAMQFKFNHDPFIIRHKAAINIAAVVPHQQRRIEMLFSILMV